MLLVAIDTSGRNGSIALCRGDVASLEVLQIVILEGGTYSARLMPTIAETLHSRQLTTNDIDAYVVVSGPGSFTGLRVGLATVKGLADVLQKPVVAVSMLEAVAVARGPNTGAVSVVLDAGRGEVYAGDYAVADGAAKLLLDHVVKLEFLVANADHGRIFVTPDAKVADAFAGRSSVKLVDAVHADEIGAIGLAKLLSGQVADPETLDANYIRRSDAELFSAPKR